MESIFTLPYPEYAVASLFQKNFKKGDDYSIQIPLSRQQKGIDLLLYHQKTKRAVSLQIKSSRSWYGRPPKRKSRKEKFEYYAWFRSFNYQKGLADFYVFFILYPKNDLGSKKLDKNRDIKKWWNSKVVIFNDNEIGQLLKEIKTKEGKPEKFFGFGFNEKSDDIVLTRGLGEHVSFKENLFENKIKEIKKNLQK